MPEEQDATEFLHRYRECCRGLWNNFLRERDFERVEVFSGICSTLFDELVLRPIGRQDFQRKIGAPIPFLRVVPSADSIPIMIRHARSTVGNHYWDDPVDRVSKAATLTFIDCFDWDVLAAIDMQYLHVQVAHFPLQPHLAGRHALVDVHDVRLSVVP